MIVGAERAYADRQLMVGSIYSITATRNSFACMERRIDPTYGIVATSNSFPCVERGFNPGPREPPDQALQTDQK